MFTAQRLRALAPNAVTEIVDRCAPALDAQAALEFGVSTPLRAAHLAAQLAYESAGFTKLVENLIYSADRIAAVWPRLAARAGSLAGKPEALANAAYADHLGNGNEASGDGFRFRGRGLLMLTGRDNYRTIGVALGLTLISNPAAAADAATATRIALYFWASRGCNEAADRDDVSAVTRLINGPALEGINAREALTKTAKGIFTPPTNLVA